MQQPSDEPDTKLTTDTVVLGNDQVDTKESTNQCHETSSHAPIPEAAEVPLDLNNNSQGVILALNPVVVQGISSVQEICTDRIAALQPNTNSQPVALAAPLTPAHRCNGNPAPYTPRSAADHNNQADRARKSFIQLGTGQPNGTNQNSTSAQTNQTCQNTNTPETPSRPSHETPEPNFCNPNEFVRMLCQYENAGRLLKGRDIDVPRNGTTLISPETTTTKILMNGPHLSPNTSSTPTSSGKTTDKTAHQPNTTFLDPDPKAETAQATVRESVKTTRNPHSEIEVSTAHNNNIATASTNTVRYTCESKRTNKSHHRKINTRIKVRTRQALAEKKNEKAWQRTVEKESNEEMASGGEVKSPEEIKKTSKINTQLPNASTTRKQSAPHTTDHQSSAILSPDDIRSWAQYIATKWAECIEQCNTNNPTIKSPEQILQLPKGEHPT
jgi:hypothetical protein